MMRTLARIQFSTTLLFVNIEIFQGKVHFLPREKGGGGGGGKR